MEPRLNVKVAELFTALSEGPGPDANFVAPGQPLPEDFIDLQDDAARNFQTYDEQRQGLGGQIQRYVDQSRAHAGDANTGSDPVPMSMNPNLVKSRDLEEVPAIAASKLAHQARGFNNAQSRPDFIMGVVANVSNGTLVQSRVVVETPNTKIAGTIIAVGDAEFAVVWDDRTASVERKADYELVVAE